MLTVKRANGLLRDAGFKYISMKNELILCDEG
jgi:hypothetical protein